MKQWCEECVHVCEELVQLSWLLPFCDGVLCNGGVETISTSLVASLPVVIAPLFGDQFFWAALISFLGLGATVKPDLRSASAKAFERAVRMALCDGVRANALRFGELADQPRHGGATMAAQVIAALCTT